MEYAELDQVPPPLGDKHAGDDESSSDFGRKIEDLAQSSGAVILRYLRTVIVAICRPSRLLRRTLASQRSAAYSTPLFFVLVSWVAYAAVNASVVQSFIFGASAPIPRVTRVLTEGLSISQVVLAAVPLLLAIRTAAVVLKRLLKNNARFEQTQTIAAYALGAAFVLLLLMNVFGSMAAKRPTDSFTVVLIALAVTCGGGSLVVATIIVILGMRYLTTLAPPKLSASATVGAVVFACVIVVGSLLAAQSVAIVTASVTSPLRLVGPVRVTKLNEELFAGSETWLFDVVFTNRTDEPAALTRWTCRAPKEWLGMSQLRLLRWSADAADVTTVPPGGTAWMEYDAQVMFGDLARRDGSVDSRLALQCRLEDAEVFAALTPREFIVTATKSQISKNGAGK